MPNSQNRIVRYSLGTLLMVVALNAFGGGYYGLAGAKNIPLEWLESSPFRNYFIPAMVLFVVVGGLSLISSILVFKNKPQAKRFAFITSIIILLWLAIQVAIIGYVSWMQPATAVAAFLILFLAWQLPRHAA
jgi:hypothetical protein